VHTRHLAAHPKAIGSILNSSRRCRAESVEPLHATDESLLGVFARCVHLTGRKWRPPIVL
jgi:hypothetical protein